MAGDLEVDVVAAVKRRNDAVLVRVDHCLCAGEDTVDGGEVRPAGLRNAADNRCTLRRHLRSAGECQGTAAVRIAYQPATDEVHVRRAVLGGRSTGASVK